MGWEHKYNLAYITLLSLKSTPVILNNARVVIMIATYNIPHTSTLKPHSAFSF